MNPDLKISPDELFAKMKSTPQILRCIDAATYADNFGVQWEKFPRTQFDSFSGTTLTSDRLERCLGPELWNNLKGLRVLEVGAGAGRFTEILLKRGARVISVDLSSAVQVNAKNFPPNENHAVVQADVMNLPFTPAAFDLVLCLGVIQHTPSPEATLAKLREQCRPGGWLVVDHYRWTLSALSMRPLYRQVLKRAPSGFAMQAIAKSCDWLLPLHRLARHSKVASVVLNRVSPLITYYRAFPMLSDEAQAEWARLDTFDGLTDHHKHYRNKRQIERALKNLKVTNLQVAKGGNGVEARAKADGNFHAG